MKFLKFAVAAVFALTFSNAYAFHSGGVAECEGCHSMHNSFDGSPNVTGHTFAQGTGAYLLKANDSSGACLNCHQAADTTASSYHISTAGVNPYDSTSPVELTPGGDFAWLKKTMNVIIRKTTALDGNPGERHGHNVVAADFGYVADSTLTVAPGGTYPAAGLSCISCHDPHGKYRRDATGAIATSGLPIWNSGSYNNSANPIAGVSAVGAYRILGGIGYQPKSLTGSFAFGTTVPAAVVASTYNRYENVAQTGIAYGQDSSEWCANCHTGMLQGSYTSGMAGLRHPAGNGADLTASVVANYNAWVRTGVMTNVTAGAAFSTLAPFEYGTTDYAALKAVAVTSTGLDQPEHAGGQHGQQRGLPLLPPRPRHRLRELAAVLLPERVHDGCRLGQRRHLRLVHHGEQDQLRLQHGAADERVQRPPGHRVRPLGPQLLQQVPREGLVSRHG